MSDEFETAMQDMADGEAVSNEQSETEQTPPVEVESESAGQERNPDGTWKTKESDESEDDTAQDADAEAGESDDSDEEETPDRSDRRRSARQRIGELTAQRNEARVRAEMAERRLHELQENKQQIDPDLEFDDPAAFTQQAVRQALAEENAQQTAQQRDYARSVELDTAKQMFQERVEAMRDELPDFDQVFTHNTPITETAVEFLAESEVGPRIAHHLGKNPSLAHRIAAMPPVKQAVELARLEGKLATPPAKRQTKAPKPASTISGAGSAGTFDPQTASVSDIAKQLGYGS